METKSSAAMRLLVVVAAVAVLAIGGAVAVAPPGATTAAPQKTTYAIAHKTGRPYRCTFRWWNEDLTANILGVDFVTVPLVWKPKLDSKGMPTELPPSATWINFARRGSTGYTWPCNPGDPPAPGVDGCRFDLARIKAETGVSLGDWIFFAAPDDDASCERIDSATIAIPSLTFKDQSQMFIDGFREEHGKTAAD